MLMQLVELFAAAGLSRWHSFQERWLVFFLTVSGPRCPGACNSPLRAVLYLLYLGSECIGCIAGFGFPLRWV